MSSLSSMPGDVPTDFYLHHHALWEVFQHHWKQMEGRYLFLSPIHQVLIYCLYRIPLALIINFFDYWDLLSILIKLAVMAATKLIQRISDGICLPKQPCVYKHSCIKIMKSRIIYLFFPIRYCYMILRETKQGNFHMTPGGAAVFLNTTQGLINSEFTLNTSQY